MNTIKNLYNKANGFLCALCLLCALCATMTSCEDMLDKGNDYVIYADDHQLTTPADTVTSVLGILNKLQAIAVRTNLLGEVRADLVTLNDKVASIDLQQLSTLDVSDENAYNQPRDYYAVINNCNYFLANADSTAGNVNRNEKYFEAEIAQVHSIRAWTYLQLVLAYGRVPFVTEPILTKLQSDAQYPMYDLAQVCDYFINDLKPYYGKAYPDYITVGSNVLDPQMFFFPTQVVTGDLYLWQAVLNHDPEAAKQAAKAYYDYIVWDLNGKGNLFLYPERYFWSESQLTYDRYVSPMVATYSASGNAAWGTRYADRVTIIPMDSASEEGYYNDLRNLYNTKYITEWKEASIVPSDALIQLSQAQTYVGYDSNNDVKAVTADKLTEDEINEGLLGDLRYWYNCKSSDLFRANGKTIKQNAASLDNIQNRKLDYQNVSIYRAAQIYLRLAEALNYAGYPRFAKQILTMGLSNTVIQYEVQPYYTSAQDSAFIQYFDFNNTDFQAYATSYSTTRDSLGVVTGVKPILATSLSGCNVWGVHSRGTGLAFVNTNYAPFHVVDSTAYPYVEASAVGKKPLRVNYTNPPAPPVVKKPSTWDLYGNYVVTLDEYRAVNTKLTKNTANTKYTAYVSDDSVGMYNTYLTVTLPAYEAQIDSVDAVFAADLAAYNVRLDNFNSAYLTWYKAAYGAPAFIAGEQKDIDQLILDEQALEMAFEGNRFFDLMRRALWYNDNSILSKAVSKRDATVGAKLMTRSNWYLKWKDKLGL